MTNKSRRATAALVLAWTAALVFVWPHTMLSGYAGEQERLNESTGAMLEAIPGLRTACRNSLDEWIRQRVRTEVARDVPTALGYWSRTRAAEAEYAAGGCPSGAFLAAGAMARTVGDEMRTAAGLE